MKIIAQTLSVMACSAVLVGCGGGNESDPKLDATNLAASTTIDNVSSNNKPKFPAPENMVIRSTSDDKPIYGNMISWDYLRVSIWNSPVTFDKPEHYEYTLDGGGTWQTVLSKPQFIGPQAYAKNKVGVRVKRNAIEGLESTVSETLFAASANQGEFVALQFVPMISTNQVVTFGDRGFDYTQANCVAEYKPDGSGEPIFWAKSESFSSSTFEQVNDKVSKLDACNIKKWRLVKADEAKRLINRSIDEKAKGFAISRLTGHLAANKNGTLVTIKETGESQLTPNLSYHRFTVWSLPVGTQLVDEIDAAQLIQKDRLNEQADALLEANDAIVNMLSALDNTPVDYTKLSADNVQNQTILSRALELWKNIYSQHQPAVTFLKEQVNLAKSRRDSKSREFVLKVSNYDNDWHEYENNFAIAAELLKELKAADSLAKLHQQDTHITRIKQTLAQASDAKSWFIGANNLRKADATYQQLQAELTAWLESLPTSKSNGALALIDKYHFLSQFYEGDQIKKTIKEALENAQSSEDFVSQSDAIIVDAAGKHYAKLDKLGLYLPKNTTYEQGWRCILEVSSGDKRRIWTLLPSGEVNGPDFIAYEGNSDATNNVLGPNGYLSQTNEQALCGVSDWKVPSLLQLQGLATSYIEGKGISLDTNVLVHHPKNQRVYYWSSEPEQDGKRIAYSYAYASTSDESVDKNKLFQSPDDTITFARLISESIMSNKWTYLNESGDLVENRKQAACARNQVTGDIWQLFDKRDDTRWVDYSDLTKRLEKQNLDQVCGFYNWRLPSINELTSLLPIMRDVFIYNDVKDIFGPAIREKYFTDFTSENDYTSLDFIEGKHTSKTQSKWLTKDKYLYRFIAK